MLVIVIFSVLVMERVLVARILCVLVTLLVTCLSKIVVV